MDLIAKIQKLNDGAASIRGLTRGLNAHAATMSGVAAVIPDDAPFPASQFKGRKVILHNVRYDADAEAIRATITLPYVNGDGEARAHSGGNFRYYIDETWFK